MRIAVEVSIITAEHVQFGWIPVSSSEMAEPAIKQAR
jgi:hypothetical protein